MEIRQLATILILTGLMISGSFIFMGDTLRAYDIDDNISNNSALSNIVQTSDDYQAEGNKTYQKALGITNEQGEVSVLGLIDFMVYGIYKTIVTTASSLYNWVAIIFGLEQVLPKSEMIGKATLAMVSILLLTIAFLVANAVFKWRI